ncbi:MULTISPECIES: OsmC family peroxiredoxin [unclassified Streptomyces]|uniref:OsmC family peroxiredoxin n=1 Tax=unclassified Streptomyces TaxID=2593676 RepID=UPI003820A78C
MATVRSAHSVRDGDLPEGSGVVTLDSSDRGTRPVPRPSRANEANGRTSPEELITAAHSSRFSMALSHGLSGAGTPPTRLVTSADVTFVPGTGITGVHLTVEGRVDGMDDDAFVAAAEDAEKNCPVSQALAGTTITLSATLA